MPNKVISSAAIKTVQKGSKSLNIRYATQTDAWKRLLLAESVQKDFVDAVESSKVPERAEIAIMAETEHPSKKDAYDHYTTVFQDKDGNHITTHHLYPPKK